MHRKHRLLALFVSAGCLSLLGMSAPAAAKLPETSTRSLKAAPPAQQHRTLCVEELTRLVAEDCREEVETMLERRMMGEAHAFSPELQALLTEQDWLILRGRVAAGRGEHSEAARCFVKAADQQVGAHTDLSPYALRLAVESLLAAGNQADALGITGRLSHVVSSTAYLDEVLPVRLRILGQMGRSTQALKEVEDLRKKHPRLTERLQLRLLQARVHADAGQAQAAAQSYVVLIEAKPADFRAFTGFEELMALSAKHPKLLSKLTWQQKRSLGECAFKKGDFEAARSYYEQAASSTPDAEVAFQCRFQIGMTWYRADQFREAARHFEGLLAKGMPAARKQQIVQRLAWSYRSLGRYQDAVKLYLDGACGDNPEECESIHLAATFTRMFAGEHQRALTELNQWLSGRKGGKMFEDALYYQAVLTLRTGKSAQAIELLRKFQTRYPDGVFTPEASWLQLSTLLSAGRHAEAKAEARRFLEKYPDSWYVPGVQAHLVLAEEQLRGKQAASVREESLRMARECKRLAGAGAWEEAFSAYRKLFSTLPHPAGLAAAREGLAAASLTDEKFARVARVLDHMEREEPAADVAWFTPPAGTRREAAVRLAVLGLEQWAYEELRRGVGEGASVADLAALLPVARRLDNQRGYLLISEAIHSRLFKGWPGDPFHPVAVRLRFPAAYEQLVSRVAGEYGIDPYLVMSLMYHESRFDRRALSPVGAWGLTQFIPSTARSMAAALGQAETFQMWQMHNPETAVRFACHYLNQLFEEFEGRPEMVLAAYNGGPHNVRQWRGVLPENGATEDFIAAISFEETRKYVRRVMLGWHRYHQGRGTVPGLAWERRSKPVETASASAGEARE